MAAALGQLIHKEYGVVRQRHFARHRPVAPTDQPRIGDGVMRGAEGPGRDQCCAVAREASDRWMRVVPVASARIMAGRTVVSWWTGIMAKIPCYCGSGA
jgi:hypothetical protein